METLGRTCDFLYKSREHIVVAWSNGRGRKSVITIKTSHRTLIHVRYLEESKLLYLLKEQFFIKSNENF